MPVFLKFRCFNLMFVLALFAALWLVQAGDGAIAQTTNPTSTIADGLQPLLEKAKKDGMSVIIISPGNNAPGAATNSGPDMQENSLLFRSEVLRIIVNANNSWQEMKTALANASPDGTWWWLVKAIGVALLGMAVSGAAGFAFRRKNQTRLTDYYAKMPENRADKISALMLRAGIIFVNCILMLVIAAVIAVTFDYGHEASRKTIFIIITSFIFYWFLRGVFFMNIIAPDLPNHRMIKMSNEDAQKFEKDWSKTLILILIALAFSGWMEALGISKDIHNLFLIGAKLVSAILIAVMIMRNKTALSGIILGAGEPTHKPMWRRAVSKFFPIAALIYLAFAWFVSSARNILDLPSANILVAAPIIAGVLSIAAYGLALLIIDRIYLTRKFRFEERVALAHKKELEKRTQEQEALQNAMDNPPEDDEEIIINQVMAIKPIGDMPVFKPVFKTLLEQASGVFILIAAIGFVLGTWDVNIGEKGNPVTGFLDTLVIAFSAWFMYRGVISYIDSRIEEEDVHDDDGEEPSGEMPSHGASRHATLLPLIKNVLVSTIGVLTAMVLLSNIGIDIAPLFAGAGVIGLAVGFGAQTLIRDFFSGAFFLFDDAFRRGEYVELDNIRGTVEKISLRSFQLRHHNGPLHTVPFGEIKQLTNYSRDWVMMKLPLRVTYDTDVEQVRKLVKKLGLKLLDNPEIGEMFLQPLKSQGVYKMEDSAMIIRVKFMAKPGDQFVMRKVVYAEIRDLFEREGIKFAHKEVTVRIAEEPKKPLSETEKNAIAAGAAQSVTSEPALPEVKDDGL